MATMMGDVTRALKQLPCVSVAAIDGRPNMYLLHVILHSICILFAFRSALRIMLIELNKYDPNMIGNTYPVMCAHYCPIAAHAARPGAAVGGGAELSCACDLRVMASSSSIR